MNKLKLVNGVFLIVLTLIVSSCATRPNMLVKPDVELPKDTGIILASITKNGGSDAWFYYKKKGSEEEFRMDAVGVSNLADKNLSEDSKRGRLLAFKAEPGNYDLTRWEMYVFTYPSYKYISLKEFVPLEFDVTAGKITYLGNLHLDAILAENFFGVKLPFGAISNISDESQRDIENLKEKYSNISDGPITKQVPDGDIWIPK